MHYENLRELIEKFNNLCGSKLTVIKDLPDGTFTTKVFVLKDYDYQGYGNGILRLEDNFNNNMEEYSYDVWGILTSEDDTKINRISLKRILFLIENNKSLNYNF